MIKVSRFDRIDEFLIHIADIALSNPNLDITSNFIYSNLICFGIESESIDNNFKYWIDAFKFKNNINVIRPDNWNYFCQFTNNIENINSIDISIDELSNIFACSRKTIINSMKELEEEKYIKKIKRGQGKNNIYIIKGEE